MIFQAGREYRTRYGRTAKIERVSPSGYAAGHVGNIATVWRPGGENAGHHGAAYDIDFYADCRSAPALIDPWRIPYPTDWDGGEPRKGNGDA